jgi:hypothetical protein
MYVCIRLQRCKVHMGNDGQKICMCIQPTLNPEPQHLDPASEAKCVRDLKTQRQETANKVRLYNRAKLERDTKSKTGERHKEIARATSQRLGRPVPCFWRAHPRPPAAAPGPFPRVLPGRRSAEQSTRPVAYEWSGVSHVAVGRAHMIGEIRVQTLGCQAGVSTAV